MADVSSVVTSRRCDRVYTSGAPSQDYRLVGLRLNFLPPTAAGSTATSIEPTHARRALKGGVLQRRGVLVSIRSSIAPRGECGQEQQEVERVERLCLQKASRGQYGPLCCCHELASL